MTDDKPLPCAFCGGKAEVLDGACFPIGCRKPDCHGWIYRNGGWSNKQATIQAWNSRAPALSVEEIEKILYDNGVTAPLIDIDYASEKDKPEILERARRRRLKIAQSLHDAMKGKNGK